MTSTWRRRQLAQTPPVETLKPQSNLSIRDHAVPGIMSASNSMPGRHQCNLARLSQFLSSQIMRAHRMASTRLANTGVPSPVAGSQPSVAFHPAPGMRFPGSPLHVDMPVQPLVPPCTISARPFSTPYNQGFRNPKGGFPWLDRMLLRLAIMAAHTGAAALPTS